MVLPEVSRAGQEETLEFRYSGKRVIRKVGTGNFFCQSYGWYPTRPNAFTTRADFELTFRYPKKYALVATGTKTGESFEGELAISTWKSEIPLAVAGFAYGDYKLHVEQAGEAEVQIYANRQPDDFMTDLRLFLDNPVPGRDVRVIGASLFGSLSPAAMVKTMGIEMANTVRLFEKYFGPQPYKRLAVANIPYSYGQGWPGLIYLSAISFLDKTQQKAFGLEAYRREVGDFFRAHESSHQWWGHRVGWKSYHDQWLSEGFAQFSGNLYVNFRRDEKEYLERLQRDKRELLATDKKGRTYESLGPVWMGRRLATFDSPAAYSTIVYNKGGYVVHMLRMMLFDPSGRSPSPDQRFINMMQEFTRTYSNRAASTEDFKAIVEKHMLPAMNLDGNGRMDWFFRQYVYSTGIPRYEFSYTATPEGDKTKITGTITQSGMPEGWKDILPIYVQKDGRTVLLGWTRATQRVSKVEFSSPFRPDKLVLNYYEDILADVKQ